MRRLLLILFCLLLPALAQAGPPGPYRCTIIATEGSSTALNDYQFKFVLPDSVAAQSNRTDMRVMINRAGTLDALYHCFEFWRDARWGTIGWYRDSVAIAATESVYVFYGSGSLVSAENCDSTFLLYDTFDEPFEVLSAATTLADFDLVVEDSIYRSIPNAPAGWDSAIRENGNILYDTIDTNPARRYKTFYSGYKAPYTDNMYVGYAYSADGLTWTKVDSISSKAAEDPYIIITDTGYVMFAEEKSGALDKVGMWTCPLADACSNFVFQRIILDSALAVLWTNSSPSSPTVWVENDSTYLFFEGKGVGSLSGCIGLAVSVDGISWTIDPNFLLGGDLSGFDSLGCVPDDIVKIGSTYYLLYHGLPYSYMGIATATNLHGPWSRSALSFAQYATVMPFKIGAEWHGFAQSADLLGLSLIHFVNYDSTQIPDPAKWRVRRAGMNKAAPTKLCGGSVSASSGLLHLLAEPNLTNAIALQTVATWTHGIEVRLYEKTINWGTAPYSHVSLGNPASPIVDVSGNTASLHQAVLQSGYSWVILNTTANQARIYEMPASGAGAYVATWTANIDSLTAWHVTRVSYGMKDSLRWWVNNIAKSTPSAFYDATFNASDKAVMLAQGELGTTQNGGERLIDWIEIRQSIVPEPTVTVSGVTNLDLYIPVWDTVTVAACSLVTVTWIEDVVPDSVRVLRDGDRLDAVAGGVLTYEDIVDGAGTYVYTLLGFFDGGQASDTSESYSLTLAIPSVVTGVAATDNRTDSVVVTWSAPSGADSLFVLRDTEPVDTLAGDAVRYADVPPVGTYSYQLIAANVCGKTDTSEVAEGTLLPTEDTETEQEQGWGNSWNGSWGSGGWGR